MATAQKKSHPAKSAASVSSPSKSLPYTNKASSPTIAAVESTRNSAETFMKMGADTVKEFFTSGTDEASKAQDKAFAIGRETAENLSRVVEACARTLNDAVSVFRQNADAAIEVCHISADVFKTMNAEMVNFANTNFVDNVELCKEAVSCRNAYDVFDVQNKWFSANMESFFAQSARMAEMSFQLLSEAAEPINERIAEATERFSKSMAA